MRLEALKFDEFHKTWKRLSKESTAPDFKSELDIHQKLLNYFQVGDSCFFIFNCTNSQVEYVSDSLPSVLGFDTQRFDIHYLIDSIHPEDLPYVMNIEYTISDFYNELGADKVLKYKARYDYRLRKADGSYIRVLQQVIPIQTDERGAVLRTLSIHTDISHFKENGKPAFSILGLDGEPSYINRKITTVHIPSREVLSQREKQVLIAMVAGNQSKDIASKLNISKETVDRHRKNMLLKTGARSTAELVAQAIREGWI